MKSAFSIRRSASVIASTSGVHAAVVAAETPYDGSADAWLERLASS